MTEQTSPPPPSGESPFPYPDDPYLKGYTREELQYPPQLTDGEAVAVVRTVGDMAAAEAAKGNSWHEIFSGITYDRKFVSAVLVPPAEDRLPLIVTVYSAAVDELAAGNQPQQPAESTIAAGGLLRRLFGRRRQ